MKLSEAIRIGAQIRPQAFGAFFQYMPDKGMCSCALGAAAEALGAEAFEAFGFNDFSEYRVRTPHPVNVVWEVSYRNDKLRQSREEIADWLESQGY